MVNSINCADSCKDHQELNERRSSLIVGLIWGDSPRGPKGWTTMHFYREAGALFPIFIYL